MLLRHIRGYAPANLVTAVLSFASIYAYTRLVSPAEYGVYALVISVTLMCQSIFFYWLQVGATRFIARAEADGSIAALNATVYRSFTYCSTIFAAGYLATITLMPMQDTVRRALLLGLALIIAKSLVAVNQSFNRGALRVLRYNIVECGQGLLGLGLSLVLVWTTNLKETGILLGLIAGAILMALLDLRHLVTAFRQRIDRTQLKALLSFGLPLTIGYALNFVLSTSDRMLVEYYLGSAAVGIYSVSYGVVDRALMSVFLAISLAAFPLVIARLEKEGAEAARQQAYRNGTALLSLVLPSCLGLIAAKDHLATVLIGPEFRAQALDIMPWIAVSTLLAGLQIHFFDHAFHLGRRTSLLLWSTGPAALLNIILNVILLPRIGLMGAVYSTLACYMVSIASSMMLGRRAFRIDFPWGPALRILGASMAMALVLKMVSFPLHAWGLVAMIALGGVTYGLAALALDIGGIRTKSMRFFMNTSQP